MKCNLTAQHVCSNQNVPDNWDRKVTDCKQVPALVACAFFLFPTNLKPWIQGIPLLRVQLYTGIRARVLIPNTQKHFHVLTSTVAVAVLRSWFFQDWEWGRTFWRGGGRLWETLCEEQLCPVVTSNLRARRIRTRGRVCLFVWTLHAARRCFPAWGNGASAAPASSSSSRHRFLQKNVKRKLRVCSSFSRKSSPESVFFEDQRTSGGQVHKTWQILVG